VKITLITNSCMTLPANSTGRSMRVMKFVSDSYKKNTYTHPLLEIIMTTMHFSALIPQDLILSSKALNSSGLRYVQCWVWYVLDFASQLSSCISLMNLTRTFSKLTRLRSASLPNIDLEYILVVQGITTVWRCVKWGYSKMMKESIISEIRWMPSPSI